MVSAGVKRIDADLVGDETYFRGARLGASWTWDDLQYYYGAEVSVLTVEDNVIDLVFKPAASVDEPCQIIAKPANDYVSFVNRTKTAAPGSPRSIEIFRPIGQNTAYVTGQLPLDASNHLGAVAVHDPAVFFLTRFREALAKHGIGDSGNLRTVGWLDSEATKIDLSKRVELARRIASAARDSDENDQAVAKPLRSASVAASRCHFRPLRRFGEIRRCASLPMPLRGSRTENH